MHMKDLLKTISEILGYKKILFKKVKNEKSLVNKHLIAIFQNLE